MDGSTDHRTFQRHHVNRRLQIRPHGRKKPIPAVLNDYSRGGLHIASDVFLNPGIAIDLNFQKTGLSSIISEIGTTFQTKDLYAKVIWCRDREQAAKESRFETGARWFATRCDWCEEPVAFDRLYLTQERLTLCPECRADFEKQWEGRLSGSIRRYLMGNVL
jgi:hypothetical protein